MRYRCSHSMKRLALCRARTVRALAMVAEVVHGAPYRFSDPARFSLAHGGKDGHPFPVPLRVYDETIRVLKSAVQKAKLGREEELSALTRLDEQARRLERHATGPTVPELIAEEEQRSHEFGGRSGFGWAPGGSAGGDGWGRANRKSFSLYSRRGHGRPGGGPCPGPPPRPT